MEMGGWRGNGGPNLGNSLSRKKLFFSAKNWTFIFLDSGIMIFRRVYRNSMDFGRFVVAHVPI